MMSGEAWLFLLAVLINAVNLFLQVFFTIMYSDLEWYVTTSSFSMHHCWTRAAGLACAQARVVVLS
jgi:hypothetical protein